MPVAILTIIQRSNRYLALKMGINEGYFTELTKPPDLSHLKSPNPKLDNHLTYGETVQMKN